MLLSFLTDCAVFYLGRKNVSLDVGYLSIYVIFSGLVWLLSVQKGLAREQLDLLLSGRWAALDLLPGNNVDRIVLSSLSQTVRCRQYQLFLALILWGGLYLNSSALSWSILCLPYFFIMGHVSLVLLQTICLWLSPKKYLTLANSIFTSLIMFFSGTAYPVMDFLKVKELECFLPTNSLIYIPSKILFHTLSGAEQPTDQAILFYIFSILVWTVLFYALAKLLNCFLRIKNYSLKMLLSTG